MVEFSPSNFEVNRIYVADYINKFVKVGGWVLMDRDHINKTLDGEYNTFSIYKPVDGVIVSFQRKNETEFICNGKREGVRE